MKGKIFGCAVVFAKADIDTDLIIPAKFLTTADIDELGQHALSPLDNTKLLTTDDAIVVAGSNFGCGSSREHAVWALTGAGVVAVIATSFARIFFRNAINYGLPIFTLPAAIEKFATGDNIEIDQSDGTLKNLTQKDEYSIPPLPIFLQKIITAGGLLNQIK